MKTFSKSISKEATHIIGQNSQDVVVSYLISKGFTVAEVNHVTSNGLDVVAIKNGVSFRIEVKTLYYSSRSWRAKKPHPHAQYVAVVFPNQSIRFETVDDWNKTADNSGVKMFTSLMKLYEQL
jgi:hypothetical protein